jgi:hypothetical protein
VVGEQGGPNVGVGGRKPNAPASNPCAGSGTTACDRVNNASTGAAGGGAYFGSLEKGEHRVGRPAFDEKFPAAVKAAERLKVLTKAVAGVGAVISFGTSYLTYRSQGDSVPKSIGKAIVATAVGAASSAILSYFGAWAGAGVGAFAGALIPGLDAGISEVVLGSAGAVAGSVAGGIIGGKLGDLAANKLFGLFGW